jgi:hypothetical protein
MQISKRSNDDWWRPRKVAIPYHPLKRIIHLRRLLLIHSYIYYELNDNLVTDHQWQAWADELTTLHARYGSTAGFYDDQFHDWDGSTGCHLTVDACVIHKAKYLIGLKLGHIS